MPWSSPFELPGYWFRGNLHTHTTQSDGQLPLEDALSWYRERGYDFVAISDHWVLTPGRAIDHDFVTISAAEVQGSAYHLLTLGPEALPPREWAEDPQRIIDLLREQGALAYLAHPYWTGRPSSETMALTGLNGIEVFNSICEVSRGTGHGRAWWDDCLTAGVRMTGLAVDDAHWRGDAEGVGYVMVRAETLTEAALLESLAAGHFYSSTGPVILDMRVMTSRGQPTLSVHCSPCTEIVFYAAGPRGGRVTAQPGQLLTHASLPLSADQTYVRVECRNGAAEVAWSNPLYVADVLEN